jgi:uracil-DNA glycosylase
MHNEEVSWKSLLAAEKQKEYFQQILRYVEQERQQRLIFPAKENVFNAFKLTDFQNIKVVILGQDPYHNDGQAHGLSFSVPNNIAQPPSLKNIFKELATDCQESTPQSGNLECWAKQGVFLLNSILTVRAHEPASHSNIGWQQFTDEVIRLISQHSSNVVFMLWGNYAIQKSALINTQKHLILTAAHPSPLSAYRGFLGCKHFSKANEFLKKVGKSTIDWRVG